MSATYKVKGTEVISMLTAPVYWHLAPQGMAISKRQMVFGLWCRPRYDVELILPVSDLTIPIEMD